MKRRAAPTLWVFVALCSGLAPGCAAGRADRGPTTRSSIQVARLDPTRSGLDELRRSFAASNPGYDLAFHAQVTSLASSAESRILFVQAGEAQASVGASTSDVAQGDIVLLRPNEVFASSLPIDALAFSLPGALPEDLPTFVRPDWDPQITDQPGGCATEEGAYRRILLTWKAQTGPYLLDSLNAHRVRITDSFTHYHPLREGFDEFYLVQMVQPAARILTSDDVDAVEREDLGGLDPADLFDETPLAVGDLVYLPRGTIHRGLGGVLAQVIAVPGFIPGAEIGVDQHLRSLNEKLGLAGDAALRSHDAPATLVGDLPQE